MERAFLNIYLRRKNEIIVADSSLFTLDPWDNPKESEAMIGAMLKNIQSLGYTFSGEAVRALLGLKASYLKELYFEIIETLKNQIGADVVYSPMYPNFPEQVMEASDLELFMNALVHYWTLGDVLPQYGKEERFPLLDTTEFKVIELGSIEDSMKIFKNLMSSKTSLSQEDKDDLVFFLERFLIAEDIEEALSEGIPLKETLALVGNVLSKRPLPDRLIKKLSEHYKTATDILRLATEMSDGDVSLASNTPFKKFKRSERRFILGLLENCGGIEEDMVRFKTKWIKLGEILHPSEYRKRYPKTHSAFLKLRNNVKIPTFGSKVDTLIANEDWDSLIEILSTRSGEFARRLDYTLRLVPDKMVVLTAFKAIVSNVSTPVLLQVHNHFKTNNRNESNMRVFFPKGLDSKIFGVKNELSPLDEDTCLYIKNFCETALKAKYMEQGDLLGKVYIDPELKNYVVPFSQRSASEGASLMTRGSRMKLDPKTEFVRMFCYWKDQSGDAYGSNRVDIDLSAVLYSDKFQYVSHVSYTQLRNQGAVHSGDITKAPNGASEFIDLRIQDMVDIGARYVLLNLYSFTEQNFSELDVCFSGFMERQSMKSGEIYEPSTVKQKFSLTSNSTIAIPMILDLQEKSIIWADVSVKGGRNSYGGNNIESNFGSVTLLLNAIVDMEKPNLYDLFMLHAESKGFLVDNEDEADTVFGLSDNATVSPVDLDVIMGQYL